MAHQILELEALPREKAGKGSARAARRQGLVPAVIYGAKEPPRLINLRRNALIAILNRGGFLSHQFEIKLPDGKSERVLPRDVQFHPVTDMPIHVDFLRLAKGARVEVEVPVQFVNEREAPGIRRGGVLTIVRHEIELEVPADNIPEFIEVDLTGLDIGDAVKISSVKLPEGARPTITDRDFTIATITAPSGMQAETAEGEGEGEAGEAAAPAESEPREED
ncbi:MAG: 50S ribosomal protein L25/general stress protein Ctc [Alphaproteobacteria bacterium]|nr:MAG: 50S ribosomal protein L25/general stress protein Ctc [Alphaproteobacteria bacterium]